MYLHKALTKSISVFLEYGGWKFFGLGVFIEKCFWETNYILVLGPIQVGIIYSNLKEAERFEKLWDLEERLKSEE